MERPPGIPRPNMSASDPGQQQAAMREAVLFQSLAREQQARNQLERSLAEAQARITELEQANG